MLIGTSSTAFFDDLVNRNKEDLNIIFTPVLKQFYEAVCQLSLHRPNDISSCFSVLHFITRHSSLARVFVSSDCWAPVSVSQIFGFSSQRLPVQGNAYEASTLIGRLAGLSCIPKPFRSSVSCCLDVCNNSCRLILLSSYRISSLNPHNRVKLKWKQQQHHYGISLHLCEIHSVE